MKTLPALLLLVVILGLACGCAVGPNYKRPAVNVPPDYRGVAPEEAAKGDARSLADQKRGRKLTEQEHPPRVPAGLLSSLV
jgi:hypothetical protein